MSTIVIFVLAGLIFAWAWYRIYQHNAQKGTRPLIAHMLGFLLGIFPAQFFLYASFASCPPAEIEPPSTMTVWTLWIIFILTMIALIYITSRPVVLDSQEKRPIKDKKN